MLKVYSADSVENGLLELREEAREEAVAHLC